jgi:hypothetical protein
MRQPRAMDITRPFRGRGTLTALAFFTFLCLHDRATQWQRIALARAFMRADRRQVHFLLFDEPVRPTRSLTEFGPILTVEA